MVQIRRCSAGRFHSVFVAVDGRVFTCGLAMNLQLGDVQLEGDRPLYVALPQLVERMLGRFCVHVDCGDEFTAYLTADGQIYTNGSGSNGCCGTGDNSDRDAPAQVKVQLPWSGAIDWENEARMEEQEEELQRQKLKEATAAARRAGRAALNPTAV